MKKIFLLTLVLAAASAVTAAVVPNKIPDKDKNNKNGSLRQDATSDYDWYCVANSPWTNVSCSLLTQLISLD